MASTFRLTEIMMMVCLLHMAWRCTIPKSLIFNMIACCFFFFSFVFAKSAFCEFDSFVSRHCRRRIYTSNDQSQKAQTTDSMLCTYIWWCFNTFIDLQQTSQFVLNAIEQRKKRIIRIVDWLFCVSYCRLIQLLKGGLKNMSQIHNDHGS